MSLSHLAVVSLVDQTQPRIFVVMTPFKSKLFALGRARIAHVYNYYKNYYY